MQARGLRSACRPWPTCWAHALPCWRRCCGAWRRTSLPPNDGTVTTRPCPASVISPLAPEAVRRIDALFEIERAINGQSTERRRAVRQELSAPLIVDLERGLREERPKLSRHAESAKAIDCMLKPWPAFTRFLDDGRICLSNNAAEQALRGIALWEKIMAVRGFRSLSLGGQRAAAIYSLIVTAKLNDVDPQAWLADVPARIAGHPAHRIDALRPGNWRPGSAPRSQAA